MDMEALDEALLCRTIRHTYAPVPPKKGTCIEIDPDAYKKLVSLVGMEAYLDFGATFRQETNLFGVFSAIVSRLERDRDTQSAIAFFHGRLGPGKPDNMGTPQVLAYALFLIQERANQRDQSVQGERRLAGEKAILAKKLAEVSLEVTGSRDMLDHLKQKHEKEIAMLRAELQTVQEEKELLSVRIAELSSNTI